MASSLTNTEEFNQIQNVVDRLVKDANAKVTFIVDNKGKLCAASGDVDNLDTTSLASLTAGNTASTGGMAKLLKENEFATQFHEGLNPTYTFSLLEIALSWSCCSTANRAWAWSDSVFAEQARS